MNTEAKHTPTPWMINSHMIYGDVETIATCNHTSRGSNADADGAFIVRAVNSHHALINALRYCVDVNHPMYRSSAKKEREAMVRAVLKKAMEG